METKEDDQATVGDRPDVIHVDLVTGEALR